MELRFLAIFRLRGFNSLAESVQSLEILRTSHPKAVATLTCDPEPACMHLDRAGTVLAGLTSQTLPGEWTEKTQLEFAARIEQQAIKRRKQFRSGVFLIFEGTTEIERPCFKARRDFGNFALALDAISKNAVQEIFRVTLEGTLAAISLEIDHKSDRRIDEICKIVYLIEPDSRKLIYCFELVGADVNLFIVPSCRKSASARTHQRVVKLIKDDALMSVSSLLTESFKADSNALRSFNAAWAALEIFIKAKFESHYRTRSETRLIAKFTTITLALDPEFSQDDIAEFKLIYRARNILFHEGRIVSPLPTDRIQNLLQKYLRLHLDFF